MKPYKHLIYGTIFSIFLYLIFPKLGLINIAIFWFSSWFIIDFDLIILYIIKKRSLNPKKLIEYKKKQKKLWSSLSPKEKDEYKYNIRIFHNLEIIVILTLLSVILPSLIFVVLGFVYHMIFDLVDLSDKKENILKKVSLIYVLIENKKRKELKI